MISRERATWFVFVALAVSSGCTTPHPKPDQVGAAVTCIQGAVTYLSPTKTAKLPYPHATVTAWDQDKNRALVDTKADKDGNYCVEVPLGNERVDIRVWGLERFEGASYICQGSVSHFYRGSSPRKCGEGECLKIDINAECMERVDPRRGP